MLENENLNEAEKPQLNIGAVSGSVFIVDEGNVNYHLHRGNIKHTYFVDEKKEFATCQCGRILHYR